MRKPTMKHIAVLLMILLGFGFHNNYALAADPPPHITSESAVLMDAKTGQVLYEKNMNTQLYPASITKILTILLGIENCSLQDTITMSHNAVFSIPRGASHIALDEGEQITMEQSIMAALLPSANDASNGIAEHVSGSIEKFASLMNQRARKAGALNSNFVNPHGLPDDAHVTTAYDMAMITRAAMQNATFRKIFETVRYTIPPTNKNNDSRDLWSEHRMLTTNRFYYQGVIGGKTGYTEKSQNTLVTVAQRGKRELIVVAMKSQGYAVYDDTIALFDYGFNQFTESKIAPSVSMNPSRGDEESRTIQDILDQSKNISITRLLHNDINPKNVVVDYQLVNVKGHDLPDLKISVKLRTDSDLMYSDLGSVNISAASFKRMNTTQKSWTGILFKILKVLALVFLGIYVVLLILRQYFKKHKKVRYRRR
jgi:D-alanyl-D-alanine carboxypeptidase